MFVRFGSPAFLTACLLCQPLPLRADSEVTATLSAPVGYDSNALLEVNPAGANPGARGYYTGAEGALALRLSSGGWEAFAAYEGDHRYSTSFGNLLWHSLEGGVAWRKGANRAELAWLAVQLVAPRYASDEFAGTGPRVGTSLALAERLRLRVDAGTQIRRNDVSTQGFSHASLSVRYLFGPTTSGGLAAQSAWLGNAPLVTEPVWQRQRFGPFVSLAAAPWALWVGPFVGRRTLGEETAGQWGGIVNVQRQLGASFFLRATGDFAREWGPEAAGRADRLEASVALGWQGRGATKAPVREDDLRPVIAGRRIRFRFQAGHARRVWLIGSFNGWAEGLELRRLPNHENIWEAWLSDPPCGPLRYRFLIDDAPQPPPQAPRYVADGFGGRDGEVNVPPTACSKKETAKHVSSGLVRSF